MERGFFFFSSRRRHTRCGRDWSSDVCSSDLPFLPGLAMIFLHRRNQRLGDVVAGTIVVRDRPTEWSLGAVPAAPDEPLEAGPPGLSDDEFRLLDQFLARPGQPDPAVPTRPPSRPPRRLP